MICMIGILWNTLRLCFGLSMWLVFINISFVLRENIISVFLLIYFRRSLLVTHYDYELLSITVVFLSVFSLYIYIF